MINAFLEDLSFGQRFGSGTARLSADDIVRLAQEFDPKPFHLDPAFAEQPPFDSLAASRWHTAALMMRPGDELHVTSEILVVRRSQSRPMQNVITVRNVKTSQNHETVQRAVDNLSVKSRSTEP